MKKVYIIILLLLCTSLTYAQENKRWSSYADIEILFPNKEKTEYSYNNGDISRIAFSNKSRILLEDKVAYGFNYSFNYRFWGGLSVGAVTGLNYLPLPQASLTAVKLGGQLRYSFEEYNAGLYLQIAGFLPLRSNIEANFGEVRLGIIPISQGEDYNFTLGLFTSYISYRLNKPLFYDQVPDIVSYRGIGVNLGIQF
ncbi:hypothetical protein [Capnocytophaga catalasegens]|uniref:Outer membrane protein beta-barrel domain-containing protein n=1 Tax=Capnocytophaga catalasegens TaxID=1004260 RepID=A0AAV5ATY0_9FLAO|nr:hypothetical protein [Capnocytophaga catalasegens]GIZ15895.1 hypothetical protein RCZ03_18950 [Capnocytophaga catalasegens]GJM49959.1 hypothetical protein RCZ15_09340 [Capnocytophaga catalasegens]GJM54149.1 hypothetical protein RCZ16_24650 [Capnocytophaga catalasegens]